MYVFADLRKFKSANHKSANRQSAKCHICGRSANLTIFLVLICEPPALRMVHLIGKQLFDDEQINGCSSDIRDKRSGQS